MWGQLWWRKRKGSIQEIEEPERGRGRTSIEEDGGRMEEEGGKEEGGG